VPEPGCWARPYQLSALWRAASRLTPARQEATVRVQPACAVYLALARRFIDSDTTIAHDDHGSAPARPSDSPWFRFFQATPCTPRLAARMAHSPAWQPAKSRNPGRAVPAAIVALKDGNGRDALRTPGSKSAVAYRPPPRSSNGAEVARRKRPWRAAEGIRRQIWS